MSTDVGRLLRMKRLFKDDGKCLVVAMDHGFVMGPLPGIANPAPTIKAVIKGGADAVMTTLGIVERFGNLIAGKSSFIFSSPAVEDMAPTVDLALKFGADAIRLFVNITGGDDSAIMASLWSASLACKQHGLPLLAEIYPTRSEQIPNPTDMDVIAKYSRIGAEAGADFIKTFYTGSVDSFRKVVESCPVPVIVLGGLKMKTDSQALQVVKDSMEAGAAGVAFGRNIWQNKDPEGVTRAIAGIIHEGWTVDKALARIHSSSRV
jgi:fructose-bisphosphate aldolase / 2-amino-3,7-dideoxy-D-threo-hept-6-ulosonate synthase